MKTTEIFIEQVLIGLLVLFATTALVFPDSVETIFGLEVDDLSTMAILVAAAYVVGIVYDRSADTLLEDLESHHRLVFALREYDSGDAPEDDPFPEDRYRMKLFASPAAVEHAHYMRSRMRLTRSLATLTPALAIALALYWTRPAADWTCVAVAGLVVAGYAAALGTRFLPARNIGETSRGVRRTLERVELPRTGELTDSSTRERYRAYIDYDADESRRGPSSGLRLALRREPVTWILLVVTIGSALILGAGTRSPVAIGLPLGGLVLTLLFTWAWWRITKTFFVFLRDFSRHYPDEVPTP